MQKNPYLAAISPILLIDFVLLFLLLSQTVSAVNFCPTDKFPTELSIIHSRHPKNIATGVMENTLELRVTLESVSKGTEERVPLPNQEILLDISIVDKFLQRTGSGSFMLADNSSPFSMVADGNGSVEMVISTDDLYPGRNVDPRKISYSIKASFAPLPKSPYLGSVKTEIYTPSEIPLISLAACLPLVVVLGLLMMAMSASGRDPFSMLDISRFAFRGPSLGRVQAKGKIISPAPVVTALMKPVVATTRLAIKTAFGPSEAERTRTKPGFWWKAWRVVRTPVMPAVRVGIGTYNLMRVVGKSVGGGTIKLAGGALNKIGLGKGRKIISLGNIGTTGKGAVAIKLAGAEIKKAWKVSEGAILGRQISAVGTSVTSIPKAIVAPMGVKPGLLGKVINIAVAFSPATVRMQGISSRIASPVGLRKLADQAESGLQNLLDNYDISMSAKDYKKLRDGEKQPDGTVKYMTVAEIENIISPKSARRLAEGCYGISNVGVSKERKEEVTGIAKTDLAKMLQGAAGTYRREKGIDEAEICRGKLISAIGVFSGKEQKMLGKAPDPTEERVKASTEAKERAIIDQIYGISKMSKEEAEKSGINPTEVAAAKENVRAREKEYSKSFEDAGWKFVSGGMTTAEYDKYKNMLEREYSAGELTLEFKRKIDAYYNITTRKEGSAPTDKDFEALGKKDLDRKEIDNLSQNLYEANRSVAENTKYARVYNEAVENSRIYNLMSSYDEKFIENFPAYRERLNILSGVAMDEKALKNIAEGEPKTQNQINVLSEFLEHSGKKEFARDLAESNEVKVVVQAWLRENATAEKVNDFLKDQTKDLRATIENYEGRIAKDMPAAGAKISPTEMLDVDGWNKIIYRAAGDANALAETSSTVDKIVENTDNPLALSGVATALRFNEEESIRAAKGSVSRAVQEGGKDDNAPLTVEEVAKIKEVGSVALLRERVEEKQEKVLMDGANAPDYAREEAGRNSERSVVKDITEDIGKRGVVKRGDTNDTERAFLSASSGDVSSWKPEKSYETSVDGNPAVRFTDEKALQQRVVAIVDECMTGKENEGKNPIGYSIATDSKGSISQISIPSTNVTIEVKGEVLIFKPAKEKKLSLNVEEMVSGVEAAGVYPKA